MPMMAINQTLVGDRQQNKSDAITQHKPTIYSLTQHISYSFCLCHRNPQNDSLKTVEDLLLRMPTHSLICFVSANDQTMNGDIRL